jgi:hypothetical protein
MQVWVAGLDARLPLRTSFEVYLIPQLTPLYSKQKSILLLYLG